MGKIYIGRNSFFGIEAPRNRKKKALINIFAQAYDFADKKTVNDEGRKVQFTLRLFGTRTALVKKYAPKQVKHIVDTFKELAHEYAKGKISKTTYLRKIKSLAKKHGLSSEEIKSIIMKMRKAKKEREERKRTRRLRRVHKETEKSRRSRKSKTTRSRRTTKKTKSRRTTSRRTSRKKGSRLKGFLDYLGKLSDKFNKTKFY